MAGLRQRFAGQEAFRLAAISYPPGGQGDVEYGRLINQLNKGRYDRALCVDMLTVPDVDQPTEMRKMRLLLESFLYSLPVE